MAKNGNGREKVIDTLIHNLTEGRASREFDSSRIEQGLRDLSIELREDKGCYWGYLRADDGEERWISWGEIEDDLRILYGLIPEIVISGETDTEKNQPKTEGVVPLVIVAQPATENAESLEGAVSVGDQVEERVAIPAADKVTDSFTIEAATSLPEIIKLGPQPADELPVDVHAKDEEAEVQKINRYSILFKSMGVGLAIAAVMGLGAAVGYSIRDFYARNEPKAVCPAAEIKDCSEADKLAEKNKSLIDKLDKIQTKVKQAEANNKYLVERKVNAENDYVEIMFSTAGQGLALAESNSALEQCNSAAKQGQEDYVGLERRLEESWRESRAKTDFLVNQSLSWYGGFSAMATLWLDAEGRYADALQAEDIGKLSLESVNPTDLNCSQEGDLVYEEKRKIEEQLKAAKLALAEADKICLYAEGQSVSWLVERDAEQAGLTARIIGLESALEKQDQVISAAEARDQGYAGERNSFISSWENEQGIALTYVDNGLAALAEKDETVLELGDHLAEAQVVFDQAEVCEQREKKKDGQLSVYAEKEVGWVRKDDAYQTQISKTEQDLAQLQEQLAQVQGQLKIAEESTYDQKEDGSGSDLVECRREQELIQKESFRISGLLEEKTSEYKSLVDSFDGERKEVQKQLTQVEKQLGEEKKKGQEYLVVKDRTAQEYSRCAEERDQLRTESDQNRSELETCLDERRDALAEQTRIQSSLETCVEEKEKWYGRSLSVRYEEGEEKICYEDGIPHETPLEDGEILSVVNVSCVSKEEWKSNYKNLTSEVVSSPQVKETEVTIKQKPAEKPAESSTTKSATDYFHKPVEQDVPLREGSYYGQLIANPARAEEIALAYVEEQGGSVTVCGKNNRDKAESLYEQMAPEGRDDVYTLEFFVKGTTEFYQGMDAKTPYCVPLTVIEE